LSFNRSIRSQKVNFESIDFGKVVDSAVSKLKGLYEAKHLEVEVKKTDPHNVWGNKTALEQIASNILKNAINYTPENGKILVSVEPDYIGNIIFFVKDSGIGMSRKELDHVFEPFYRADRSRSRKVGSSGLGLTIVNELLKMHSGKITIKSLTDRGTSVIVSLPYDKNNQVSGGEKQVMGEVSVDFSS
jgi:signal transduction histidine kinase